MLCSASAACHLVALQGINSLQQVSSTAPIMKDKRRKHGVLGRKRLLGVLMKTGEVYCDGTDSSVHYAEMPQPVASSPNCARKFRTGA